MAVLTQQELRAKVLVETSAIYEMMASLREAYLTGGRDEITRSLGGAFRRELEFFYGSFDLGAQLTELAVDFPDQRDVPGFLEWVSRMPEAEFLYYSLGRYAPKEEIETILHKGGGLEELASLVERHGGSLSEEHRSILEDAGAFKKRLLNLWRRYWEVAEEDILSYEGLWQRAASSVEEMLQEDSWPGVVNHLLRGKELPQQFPPGTRLRELTLIPSVCISPSYFIIWGHGRTTVVFDAALAVSDQPRETTVSGTSGAPDIEELVTEARALSEPSRLRILAAVRARSPRRAVELAGELGLSTATISRHVAVLRKAGFIEEEKRNRGVYYRVNERRLNSASPKVWTWITDKLS